MQHKTFDELLKDALAKEPDLKITPLNMDKVRAGLPEATNEKLCEMIVCDRYFGFGEQISSLCMTELSKRRIAGDTFDFETYIDQAYKSLPEINNKVPDLRDVLQQAAALRPKK